MPLPALPAVAAAVAKATPVLLSALGVLSQVASALTKKKNENAGAGYQGVAQTVAAAEKPLTTSTETLTQLQPALQNIQSVVSGLGKNPSADQIAKALDAAGVSVAQAGSIALEAIKGVRSSQQVTTEALRVGGKEPAIAGDYHVVVTKLNSAETELTSAGATVRKSAADFAASATAR